MESLVDIISILGEPKYTYIFVDVRTLGLMWLIKPKVKLSAAYNKGAYLRQKSKFSIKK